MASKQIYDKDYSFNAHVNGDAQRYGLALVGPECSRQLEHWWYLAGARVITESEVAPLSMAPLLTSDGGELGYVGSPFHQLSGSSPLRSME